MVSDLWVTTRHFRPAEWARLQEVGCMRREDEQLWGPWEGVR